jgi:acyl-CoA synthetase (AMP-forming)/AMP-acid ligase II
VNLDRFFAPHDVPPLTNLGDCLRYWADRKPDSVAFFLTDGETEELQLSYAELLRSSEAIAAELIERG